MSKDAAALALESFKASVAKAPGRHAFAPRLAEPGRSLTTQPDARGLTVTLHAEDYVVRPASAQEVEAADALGLAVITDVKE